MGSVLTRNRFWWYRSLYDDYVAREAKNAVWQLSSGYHITSKIKDQNCIMNIFFFDSWGIHLNRAFEVSFSHRNYAHEWGPRRNRLTHSLEFEQFEMILENWQDLEDEYAARGEAMLKQ